MILSHITLTHFRNFTTSDFSFSPTLTVIIGENARGKTSLLESIYFSVVGVGFRETREEELLQWNKDESIVESIFLEGETNNLFQIRLRNKGETVEKMYYVNKTHKSHYAYKQFQTLAVLFAPEHIEIVTGSPDKRREYFNKLITAFDTEYGKKLRNYEHALRKRNKVLEHYHNEQTLKEELLFWDAYLIENGSYVTQKRHDYVNYLNENQSIDHRRFQIEYLKNEFTQERVNAKFDLEKKIRKTQIGPQKDDFAISLDHPETKNVHSFGSRSEQRLAVFWLKLNEIKYFETIIRKKPILLLDDVFSELDTKNKKLVLDVITHYQTIITTTENELLDLSVGEKEVIRL